jgi:uncharacterized zinc-type alcohol dehydrogenase-like protein
MRVIAIGSRSDADALAPGASRLPASQHAAAMAAAASSLDLIIDTVAVKHDINPYTAVLDIDGTAVSLLYWFNN